ncbi:hypothetical protein PR048_008119 [Dryococelus australis]|uniref:Uncharacterized protein n=1 Tax=Dryococelus australis TaxID=614101 RepID=A0ABQ9HW66_9NEOP|nr:hypothetical protein PR048_008119 [Dryococelus australis]
MMAAEAEKAYEFTEDVSETACEKLSSFRRRRLADKKYEFCEEGEDAENIVPFRLHRRRESSPRLRSPPRHFSPSLITHRRRYHENIHLETPDLLISSPLSPLSSEIHSYSPQSSHIETDKVLRPLNRNTASAFLLSPRDRESSVERVVKCSSKKLQMLENVVLPDHELTPHSLKQSKKEISSPSSGNDPVRCTTELKRRFIEVDDELVSVITDIEGESFYLKYNHVS